MGWRVKLRESRLAGREQVRVHLAECGAIWTRVHSELNCSSTHSAALFFGVESVGIFLLHLGGRREQRTVFQGGGEVEW